MQREREREREKERDAVGGGNMLPRYGTRGDLGEPGAHPGPAEKRPSRLADQAPPSKEQRGVDGVGHERWVRDKDEVMTEQMAGTSRMISSPPRE